MNPYTNNANRESFAPFGPGGYNIAIAGPLDISDPPDSIRSVKVKDGYAYLVVESRDAYIWIVDVTDPADPDVIKKEVKSEKITRIINKATQDLRKVK